MPSLLCLLAAVGLVAVGAATPSWADDWPQKPVRQVAHASLPYDPERDLVPIASASDSFLPVAVNPSLGVDSIDALIAHARAAPGKLSWAATPGLPQFIYAISLRILGVIIRASG